VTAAPADSAAASAAPSAAANLPKGWTIHDIEARAVVRRYIGNLAPALKGIYGDAAFAKLADILGAADNYPELGKKPSFVDDRRNLVIGLLWWLKKTGARIELDDEEAPASRSQRTADSMSAAAE
jgi:hypothetical protein